MAGSSATGPELPVQVLLLDFGPIALELSCVALDHGVPPLQLGAHVVPLRAPEIHGLVVPRCSVLVQLRCVEMTGDTI